MNRQQSLLFSNGIFDFLHDYGKLHSGLWYFDGQSEAQTHKTPDLSKYFDHIFTLHNPTNVRQMEVLSILNSINYCQTESMLLMLPPNFITSSCIIEDLKSRILSYAKNISTIHENPK